MSFQLKLLQHQPSRQQVLRHLRNLTKSQKQTLWISTQLNQTLIRKFQNMRINRINEKTSFLILFSEHLNQSLKEMRERKRNL